MNLNIRKATPADCRAIAELTLMAGEGIPTFFWQQPGQDIIDIGAKKACSETGNFSYHNVHLAELNNEIAAMLLAYKLPEDDDTNLDELPEIIRPLIELEQCVPGSFYINMIATYPQHRGKAVGTKLLGAVDQLAKVADCELISLEVFEQNDGALRLYQRLDYNIIERRKVVPHECYPYTGDILLLTRTRRDT